ncbi:MAG: hypothetical protein F6K26_10975 [Moorea sp. SIO2I5]|nr:hypothetical protein [Moorena sp. SIO2I5]
MDAYIKFEGNVNEDDSYNLKKLANIIQEECDLPVKVEKKEAEPGVRDGGLAMGIAIASLTLAAIQTLFSVLQYWESKQPKYSLSISFENQIIRKTLLIESSSAEEIKTVISNLQAESSIDYIEVQVYRKE